MFLWKELSKWEKAGIIIAGVEVAVMVAGLNAIKKICEERVNSFIDEVEKDIEWVEGTVVDIGTKKEE